MKLVRVIIKANPRVVDIVRFIAYSSGGRTSGRRVAKLAYLANLLHLEKYGEPIAEVSFVSEKFGPWSVDIARAYDNIEADSDDMEVVSQETPKGRARVVKPTKPSTVTSLGAKRHETLREIFDVFRFVKTDEIVTFTKRSSLFKGTEYLTCVDYSEYLKTRNRALTRFKDASVGTIVSLPSLGYQLRVRVEKVGYSATCTELKGVVTQGDSLEELEASTREAIVRYLECEAELRETPP